MTETVIHVNDASRAVNVVSNLLHPKKARTYKEQIRSEYESFRERFLERRTMKTFLPYEQAQQNSLKIDWKKSDIYKPNQAGARSLLNFPLEELVPYIDWSPFFRSWDLHGKYPEILVDDIVGSQATSLFEDAQAMLDQIVNEKWLEARARFGIFPANSVGDDIEVYSDENRNAVDVKCLTLRQQLKKKAGEPNLALADFIAPKTLGFQDYIGFFCVSTGFGTEQKAKQFEDEQDDYNSILVKALSDRLAEAFAERLHERVRTDYWGYASAECFTNEELIKEAYIGIRPAPGYPSCPDHSPKRQLFELLDVPNETGIDLTESFAMMPTASVSGYYFSHPDARYFGIGRVGRDQVEDYARRRGEQVQTVEHWLAPNLVYDRS